ncbi:MAG: hypothetical protein R6U15_06470 [Candidatus Izemoplasmatales bacterium]
MKTRITLIILTLLLMGNHVNVFSQKDSIKNNSIFIQVGGGLGDFEDELFINYARKIPFNEKIGLNVGIGYYIGLFQENKEATIFEFPIHLKTYYQVNKNNFYLGTTVTPYIARPVDTVDWDKGFLIDGEVSYKYSLCDNNSWYIGISIYPISWNSYNNKFSVLSKLSLHFGIRF